MGDMRILLYLLGKSIEISSNTSYLSKLIIEELIERFGITRKEALDMYTVPSEVRKGELTDFFFANKPIANSILKTYSKTIDTSILECVIIAAEERKVKKYMLEMEDDYINDDELNSTE